MEPKSIDQLFWDAAQHASVGERDAYLDRACAGDIVLREGLNSRTCAER